MLGAGEAYLRCVCCYFFLPINSRLWKEVVERRQQQPLQLALSMKDMPLGVEMGVQAARGSR